MGQYTALDQGEVAWVADLRSDTVTRPDNAMRAAMAAAEVGDDVFGDDPTIARLEATLAERLGKEAALFVPSGTQSNLIAIMSHCGRGEEVITGKAYHVNRYEAGGAAVLGSCVFDTLPVHTDGGLLPGDIQAAVKEDDFHHAVSRLLSLENTHNGKVVPLARIAEATAAGRAAGLMLHLDGARVFNASVALGRDVAELAAPFDTVSVCLSKGLGAPVGSVLVGPAPFVVRARRLRKMLGGGMRQAGVLAAAGLHALEHNVARLSEDHQKAAALAEALRAYGDVEQNTNMVFLQPSARADLIARFTKAQVRISADDSGPIRFVLHKDVSDTAMTAVLQALG
ncbi:low-specificity L-threonine aldolase [Epibacterium sp. SM1969]|uniref:Low-specificity L-threonine aldolase n=1 Tax=Tritonibacter aquimaris TaxID=2663379 RepID=A0A844AZ54_9RHOB|nr:low-specificity L-threonine aldolase [Tritonibacter aquimaris]MQY42446.1 low-specificity L-threonine aldolase [Tritonibacter aquimaris]